MTFSGSIVGCTLLRVTILRRLHSGTVAPAIVGLCWTCQHMALTPLHWSTSGCASMEWRQFPGVRPPFLFIRAPVPRSRGCGVRRRFGDKVRPRHRNFRPRFEAGVSAKCLIGFLLLVCRWPQRRSTGQLQRTNTKGQISCISHEVDASPLCPR